MRCRLPATDCQKCGRPRWSRTSGSRKQRFSEAFAKPMHGVECTFRHEKTLMEAAGHPGLRDRRRDNAALLGALRHAASRVEAGTMRSVAR